MGWVEFFEPLMWCQTLQSSANQPACIAATGAISTAGISVLGVIVGAVITGCYNLKVKRLERDNKIYELSHASKLEHLDAAAAAISFLWAGIDKLLEIGKGKLAPGQMQNILAENITPYFWAPSNSLGVLRWKRLIRKSFIPQVRTQVLRQMIDAMSKDTIKLSGQMSKKERERTLRHMVRCHTRAVRQCVELIKYFNSQRTQ
ncbi:hypothetical protein [Deinococcus cellulosilyticus]|uniref:Uncharacterized protein n=1 Tax=Deinococcus cellulosilyticus (strain DSM 18568 / NBRC 106333 / KACC 11606 / 5516J-15) TaxID=1223518 RepID=A0A511NAK6_DEIC1|nr:hypothetical protein [Deinococcus cellulosilyticus]GEM49840.1 hypothetical protein DC3_54750 [Deinococcus cellulosilyticus NBRC 106333 = KACC 11606]